MNRIWNVRVRNDLNDRARFGATGPSREREGAVRRRRRWRVFKHGDFVYRRFVSCIVALGVGMCASCASSGPRLPASADLGVNRIEIQPFTRLASFNGDDVPDGISAWVQAHDAFGDPVKLVGDLVFELYSRRKASAEPKGERLIPWTRTIHSRADQETFWDRPSQSYLFELAWNAPPRSMDVFIHAVTLTTPDGLHFSDEYEIRVNVEALRDSIAGE